MVGDVGAGAQALSSSQLLSNELGWPLSLVLRRKLLSPPEFPEQEIGVSLLSIVAC